MGRFIVRSSSGDLPAEQVAKLRSAAGVTVVDDSPKMVLLDGEEQAVQRAVSEMPNVTVSHEAQYKVPSPHPSVPKPEKPKPEKKPQK